MKFSFTDSWLKCALGWTAVFLFRLIPFRPPNFEPMLATVMPFSKRYGMFGSFAFGFFGIVLYDAVTSGWGTWTAVTALAYGLTVGPLFNGQSFAVALAGQIPFTLMHLLGAVVFGALLSPALYRWVIENKSFDVSVAWTRTLAFITGH